MMEFAIVMLEESFISCQPIAHSCSGQLRPLAEKTLCLPPSALPSLCNSVTTQLLAGDLLDSVFSFLCLLPIPVVTSSAEHTFSHTEKPESGYPQGQSALTALSHASHERAHTWRFRCTKAVLSE